ncbi:MAG: TetR/AcrR family transcriptional regulator [Sandaracinaceae bacterium]|jgi:AcrR family transcriptional regulator|nr:TetR/AcrR family transcriptional regulator [Sandaracinaceae bacterium]MBK8409260.1 TetR/AcrR family transcriptional regulator [Sandaracinaceae bacterium]MBP7681047.1 TetR/AcrR family transcriptional regulator [Deltaproteobacteria bacterium]
MQTLKPEVRERVLLAGEAVFAEAGYAGATMAGIASRAGVSTGNVYRYFASKDALFDELFPPAFAAQFLALLRKRVRSLTEAPQLRALDPRAEADGQELLRFWLDHRRKVVVVLSHAEGSRLASFRQQFVTLLVDATAADLRKASGRPLTKAQRLVLTTLFENTARMLVAILGSDASEADVVAAFAGFWSYQLAGLAGFKEWVLA